MRRKLRVRSSGAACSRFNYLSCCPNSSCSAVLFTIWFLVQNADWKKLEHCVGVPCFDYICFGKTFSSLDPDESKTGALERQQSHLCCGRFRLNFTCISFKPNTWNLHCWVVFHCCEFLSAFKFLLNTYRILAFSLCKMATLKLCKMEILENVENMDGRKNCTSSSIPSKWVDTGNLLSDWLIF